ncbi:DNA-directed RNA polymerase I, putative [Theileria equi strain WA]|uniref:DNA-directed RNA polymerase I, putative n=1 Tax=Theileria equi strain WA TaxID=1537102 RepID=L0AY30_THEEQ|nr:DNA-directed RNA polymerase I, putative [Theileria equi strain WA]AFZ79819.1 DNA-directed RNA polymerase I, putative [Theileria equi strain WA]|eukprot:XP_004829485.1 DNA-directed RNA polymerase I, putative [Theileria equi strain WA]
MPNFVYLDASGIKYSYDKFTDQNAPSVLEEIKNVKIRFIKNTKFHSVVEFEGLNVSIANALRRILIAEIPTLAIETVEIRQNTGVVQDELLAHRLGLVPFNVDPEDFSYKNHESLGDKNSLCFKLSAKCLRSDSQGRNTLSLYAKDLVWHPFNEAQKLKFQDDPPRPIHGDILLTKLAGGQELDLTAYLEKGIGKTHSKWSPVSTAVYRFKPEITFSEEFPLSKSDKEELCELCPMDVFSMKKGDICIEDTLSCTSCRACVERFPKSVIVKKLNNHIIFSIESTGAVPSATLLLRAIEVLKNKSIRLMNRISELG